MIIDNIKNCEKYESVHEAFKEAFDAIKMLVSEKREIGKYEINDKKVYAMVQEYTSKTEAERKFEAHKKYIDIQFIVNGQEQIQIGDLEGLKNTNEFNLEKDSGLFEAPELYTSAVLKSGDFAVIYPNEAHAPGIALNDTPSNVKKIVVKVLL